MRAVALVREHQALAESTKLYETARGIPGVVEAYPTLGSHDGVVFVEASSLRDLRGVLHHLEGLSGVDGLETMIEEGDGEDVELADG